MSWDAWLVEGTDARGDHGRIVGEWNYTGNTSVMIYTALANDSAYEPGLRDVSWFAVLDGMSGPDGARFLHTIIGALEADPARFEALNPANGWGSYRGLLAVLTEMRNAVPEYPTTWAACG